MRDWGGGLCDSGLLPVVAQAQRIFEGRPEAGPSTPLQGFEPAISGGRVGHLGGWVGCPLNAAFSSIRRVRRPARRALGLNRRLPIFPRRAVCLAGRAVRLAGRAPRLTRRAVCLNGRTICLTRRAIRLAGRAPRLNGRAICLAGRAIRLTRRAVCLTRRAVRLNGQRPQWRTPRPPVPGPDSR